MGLLLTHGGADLLLSRDPAPLWGGIGGHGLDTGAWLGLVKSFRGLEVMFVRH